MRSGTVVKRIDAGTHNIAASQGGGRGSNTTSCTLNDECDKVLMMNAELVRFRYNKKRSKHTQDRKMRESGVETSSVDNLGEAVKEDVHHVGESRLY